MISALRRAMTRRLWTLTIMVFAGSLTTSVSAQNKCWTAVGSDGAVDEADLGQFAAAVNQIGIRTTVSSAVVNIRYNVVAVDGVFGGEAKQLRARLADNGPNAQVIVQLQRMNIKTGVRTTLITLDSDEFPASSVAQARSTPFACLAPEFDFGANVYFVDVTLIKRAADGNPLIRAIQICGNIPC